MHPNRLLLFHQMCFLLLPGCCCARCVCTSRCQCTLRVLQSSSSSSSSSKPTLISIPLTLPTIRNPHLTEFFLFPVYKATLYPSRRLLLLLLPLPPSILTNPVAPCATSEIIICSIWKVSFQTQCASSTRHTTIQEEDVQFLPPSTTTPYCVPFPEAFFHCYYCDGCMPAVP